MAEQMARQIIETDPPVEVLDDNGVDASGSSHEEEQEETQASSRKPRKTAMQAAIAVSLTAAEIFNNAEGVESNYKILLKQINPFSSYRANKHSSWWDMVMSGVEFFTGRWAAQTIVYGIELPLRLLSDGLAKLSDTDTAWKKRSGGRKFATVALAPLRLPVEALAFVWSHSGNLVTRVTDTFFYAFKLEGKKAWDSLKQVGRHTGALLVPAGIATAVIMLPEVLSPIVLRDLVLQLSGDAGAAIGASGVIGVEALAYLAVISVITAVSACIYGIYKIDEGYTNDRIDRLRDQLEKLGELEKNGENDEPKLERHDSYRMAGERFVPSRSNSICIDSESGSDSSRPSTPLKTGGSKSATRSETVSNSSESSAFFGSKLATGSDTLDVGLEAEEAAAKARLAGHDEEEDEGVLFNPYAADPNAPPPSPTLRSSPSFD